MSAKQAFKIYEETAQVKQTAPWLHLDQKIHIAFFVCVPPRHGAEHAHVVRAVLCGNPENLFALGL
jgi:hypothetical protein